MIFTDLHRKFYRELVWESAISVKFSVKSSKVGAGEPVKPEESEGAERSRVPNSISGTVMPMFCRPVTYIDSDNLSPISPFSLVHPTLGTQTCRFADLEPFTVPRPKPSREDRRL
ncbi:MAG: hypothetical protein AB9869_34705 [Verrucomicrobiia bacterium]